MSKIMRISSLLVLVALLSLTLAACGNEDTTAVAPYGGAKAFELDANTQNSFKEALKGIKDAKIESFTTKDDPTAVKAFYDSQYKDKGWTNRAEETTVAEAIKAQTANAGWALAYEKGSKVVSISLTPSTVAASRFANTNGENVLVVISASK